jgi:hypothetical protein
VNDVLGVEVLETLRYFRQLKPNDRLIMTGMNEKTNQFIHVRSPIVIQIIKNCPMLHPRRNHAKRCREGLAIDSNQRQDTGMLQMLPDESLSAKLLPNCWFEK